MFQRFFAEGLAQSSCLIGCDRTKQASQSSAREGFPQLVNIIGGMAAFRQVEAT